MSKSQYRSFFLAANDDGAASEALNRFIRSHVILSVEREYCAAPVPGWAFCVVFEASKTADAPESKNTGKGKVDYRALLSADLQLVFDRMRDVRAELADAEGKKRYHVLTDAHLYALLQQSVTTVAELKNVTKINDDRAKKYAEPFLVVLRELHQSTQTAAPPE
ncbi:hypothetical protein AB833_15820 [Chromatiales bacterium (ex Bugula neritina AB1)]|nr:hypothetical protein AB833_15820 [Chromatiales bacterium (ex Bugula neritina AB1)]